MACRSPVRLAAAAIVLILAAVACASPSPSAQQAASPTPTTAPTNAPKGTVDPETGQQLNAPPDPITAALPAAVDAGQCTTRTAIKHVVFLLLENRSFDNIFGTYPGANGATAADDRGVPRPLTPAPLQRAHALPHCYNCNVASIDGGLMDGFSQTDAADQYAFTQFHRSDVEAYWSWAKHYVLA